MSDLISRQEAIDAIHNLYAIHGSEGSWIDQKDAFKALNNLPSAQPTVDAEPEHGHWIISGEWCTCSECKQSLHYERSKGKSNLINALSMAVNFCPNCGAKMDEKVTRETE